MESNNVFRYVIVCLIKGSALKFHENAVSDICSKFKVSRQRLPAHFTIKAPFETDKIEEIETLTEGFVNDRKKEEIEIEGIGHFGTSTVFMSVHPNDGSLKIYHDYINELRKFPWLEWRGANDGAGKNFHATIVTKLRIDKFNDIWAYAKQNYNPHFSLYFDNISILRWDKGRWITYKEYILK
jgi:2'-5' RNA ligase